MLRRPPPVAGLAVALVLACGLVACDEDPNPDIRKDTLNDPLGDVAHLGGYLFATNDDHSGHAGSQVDLLKFDLDGFPVGRFDLGLNGVGYLAAAAAADVLYLQARSSGQLFKVSPVGEIGWTRADPFTSGDALACGVAYRADLDSFVVVYRRPGTTSYTTRRYGPGFAGAASAPRFHDWPTFAGDTGVRSVAWADGWLWALGLGADGQAVIQGFRDDGSATRIMSLDDASACGLTAIGDSLYVAYADRDLQVLDLTGKAVGRVE